MRQIHRFLTPVPAMVALFAGMTLCRIPASAQDASLVGWWKLDETSGTALTDSSGSGNGATLNGTFTRVTGRIGGAISFGGASYASSNKAAVGFPSGTTARTISAWIKIPAPFADGNDRGILHYGAGNTFHLFVSRFGTVGFGIGGVYSVQGNTRVDDGNWHHIAGVYLGASGNAASVYVDGRLDQSGVLPSPDTGAGGSWLIGQFFSGGSFPGAIDDLRIYSRVVSDTEIQAQALQFGVNTLTVTPISVRGGSSATGTVTIFGTAPSGGAVVSLASSSAPVASVPASVTVPAGANSATFTVAAGGVTVGQLVTITASYSGASLSTTLTVVPANQDPSLVGWWRFDEAGGATVNDSSGNGNTGTLTGTIARVPGQVGNAISFAGTAYVTNAKAAVDLPFGTTPRTMTAWVRIPAKLTDNAMILSQDDSYFMNVNSNGVLSNGVTGLTRLDDGKWHHVASVYNGTGASFSLYVDGQLDQTGTGPADPNNKAGGNWSIGRGLNGTSKFPGTIDEVRLYSRALSVSEIQSMITGDGGTLAPVPVFVSQMSHITPCAPKPAPTSLAFGDVSTCSIDTAGEVRQFKVQANAGDKIWVNVQRTAPGDMIQCYQVIDPDNQAGAMACQPYNPNAGPNYLPSLIGQQQLVKTGLYTIQVSGSGSSTFPFAVGLKRETPLPPTASQLTLGVAAQSFLTSAWDWHYYSAWGTAGDKLSITLNRSTPGDIIHCLRIYAPSGQVVSDGCQVYNPNAGPNYLPALSTSLTLSQTGGYFFRVSDVDNLNSFSYSLAVNCTGACSKLPVATPPQICSYSLSPPSELITASAFGGVLGITAPTGCPWNVSSSNSFLSITTNPAGGGTDTIGFVVSPNIAAAARTSVVSVGGQTSTITQLGTSPLLSVTPNPLVYNALSGTKTPTTILMSVFTDRTSLAYTASVAMTTAPSFKWLSISSTSGSAPTTIAVTVDPSQIPPGTFNGSVTVNSPTASPSQIVIPVTVTIQSSGAAVLSVAADPITFNLSTGGADGVVRRAISNTGTGFLSYTASVENASTAPWLSVTPGGGSVNVTTPDSITIDATPGTTAGTYRATVLVSSGNSTVRIPVSMTVGIPSATILISQTGLSYTGVAGGGSPSPQVFGILNSGVGTLHWTAKATTITGGSWLKLDSTSGTVNRPLMDVSLLTVSVDTSRLNAGDYYGKIEIAGDAVNTPQLVTVYVQVLPSGSNPGPEVRPTGLIFIGPPGRKTTSQPVGVTNIIDHAVAFTASPATFDGSPWLSHAPLKASVSPNTPGRVDVTSDNSSQSPGVLHGAMTLIFDDGRSAVVNILNVVSPASASANAVEGDTSVNASVTALPRATSCSSGNLYVQFVALRPNFQAALGKPVTISVKAADECGNALVPTTGASTPVSASFSNGDPDLQLVSEGSGQWSGTWNPTKLPGSGSAVTVTIHAAFVNLASRTIQTNGSTQVTGSLLSSVTSPVPTGKVVDSAKLDSGPSAPVAPGELVTIYGASLAGQSFAPTLPLPSNLAGTTVLIGGVPVSLLYSGPDQINAQLPFGLPVNSTQQIVISTGDSLSVPIPITVADTQPGIFAVGPGTGQGIIFRKDKKRADSANPVRPGDVITMYCSGLGQVTPNVPNGVPAPADPATTVNPVTAQIGGLDAQVQFAGLIPGMVTGVYQVRAVVPQGVASGNAVPVTITSTGLTSNTVTMAVVAP